MFFQNAFLGFPIHALPPVMLGLAAVVIVVSAAAGLGITLIRGVVAAFLAAGKQMPPSLKRWHRALTPVRRHVHYHEWHGSDRRAFRAKD